MDFTRLETARRWFRRDQNREIKPIEMQKLSDVEGSWPTGRVGVRCNDFMSRPHQRWTIENAGRGGYMGQPYYKISIEGTNRVLTATAEREVVAETEFTGDDNQLWRIDMLIDGTYRIMPKAVPGTQEKLALVSIGDSSPTLAAFDFQSDNSKWNLKPLK